MLNIPDSVKALFKQDGVYKNFRAHFPNGELSDITNENIVQESVKFTESVCSQDVFKFGLTEASVIEFETVGVANMYGMTIECSCEIDCSSLSAADKAAIAAGTWDGTWDGVNEVFAVPYGTFRVESCPRDHQAMTHRKVTAYTESIDKLKSLKWFIGLPTELITSSIKIDSKAILSAMFGTGLSTISVTGLSKGSLSVAGFGDFYDSNGTLYNVMIRTRESSSGTWASPGASSFRLYSYSPAWRCSFVKCEATEATADIYNAFGEKVVELLSDYDLTYNQNGVKKYATNLDAVKAKMPYLFAPVICYRAGNDSGSYYDMVDYAPLDYGMISPVIQSDATKNIAETAISAKIQNGYSAVPSLVFIAGGSNTQYRITISYTGGGAEKTIDAPFPLNGAITATIYTMDTFSAKLEFLSVDEKGYTYTSPIFGKKYKKFSFDGALDFAAMLNGAEELEAKFVTVNRHGGLSERRLSTSSSTAIVPGEYSQMWFDEYDVEPIGTIRYSYTDDAGEEQIVDYLIGDGASIYDMTDNAVLKAMGNATRGTIEAMLQASFVPYLAAVNFTPIDLAAKGLPYLEAGDAISVTAQDGTVCNSYALRQEVDGIQSLTAQIDSQSGLIIESEAAT